MPTTKRIQNIQTKYEPIKDVLDEFKDSSEAFIQLNHMFTTKDKILLKVIVRRYYNKITLTELGKTLWSREVSREYVRQCEDKAIKTIHTQLGGGQLDATELTNELADKEFDSVFNSEW